jgi:hypothetical protein
MPLYVRGNRMKIGVGTEQIDGEFRLREESGPVIDWERRVCCY